jgi:hypothetical protein
VTVASELPLKLARKCVDIFGYASFDEEQAVHTLNPGCDDEIATVTAGKEFGLLKTVSGKVYVRNIICTKGKRFLQFVSNQYRYGSIRMLHI